MLELKHILVPVDFEECSKRAFELAATLADACGAELEVLHVVTPTPQPAAVDVESATILDAEEHIVKFLERVRRPPRVRIRISAVLGLPQDTILARARAFDLVVMGTHGRRGLAHMLLGSVTEKCIRECARPILVVNAQPKDHREAAALAGS